MERAKKAVLNAKVSLFFSVIIVICTLFSRKVFIGSLGDNFIGLTATIINILSFLSLAEMGISTAVSFFLYKSIHEDRKGDVSEIVSVLGFYYRRIGYFIGASGIIVSLFLSLIFSSASVSIVTVYATFFTFLLTSLLGYFFNYKQFLFIAYQKNYLVTTYINVITVLKLLSQVAILTLYRGNFYFYLLAEIVFSCIVSIVINRMISKEYPWLESSATRGKPLRHKYSNVIRQSKQLFSHSFAGFILNQTDYLLVFSLSSLRMVTVFSNYMLIIQKVCFLINDMLGGSTAGVGNLIAAGDRERIRSVFGELRALRYWVAGIIIFSFYELLPSFIQIWLGSKYILDNEIFLLLLVNLHIMITRQTTLSFTLGYGLFKDTWAPWTEAILNIGLSILLGLKYGVAGVTMGTTISLFIIVVLWKPYFLFKEGFKQNIADYWSVVISYVIQFFLVSYFLDRVIVNLVDRSSITDFYKWFSKAFLYCGLHAIMYGLSLYMTSLSMRRLVLRLIKPYRGKKVVVNS